MRKLVALVALAAVALVACGTSESDKESVGPGVGKDTTGETSGGGGGDNGFSDLLTKSKEATYKVTYESGDDDPVTIAQDPPRFAYSTGDTSAFVLEDGTAVTCSGAGEKTCTQMPGSGDTVRQSASTVFGGLGALFLAAAGSSIPGLAGIKTNEKKIVGRDAQCATIDSESLGGVLGAALQGRSYSVCVDEETGVMLQTKSTDGGTTSEIVATEFTEPTDADFTPPSTPRTIPGLTPTTT